MFGCRFYINAVYYEELQASEASSLLQSTRAAPSLAGRWTLGIFRLFDSECHMVQQ